MTKIEWAGKTWNPVTGCNKISAGCKHCYAERMAKRLKAMGQANYVNGFEVTCHPHMLERPFQWKKPQTIFVNSMSDVFHKDVPLEFIKQIFDVMKATPRHTYQLLTKRAERLAELAPQLDWPQNVWMGVSTENQAMADKRIPLLLQVPAKIRFLSIEPLLEVISIKNWLDYAGLHWVIVGGESGPNARPMPPEAPRLLRDECIDTGVPFFFKQWGEFDERIIRIGKKQAGRLLDGVEWSQFPEVR